MSNDENFSPINSALVTGATGLLGNNLVRLLVSRGVHVKALVRSREKAETQLAGLPVEIVVGQMTNVRGFAKTDPPATWAAPRQDSVHHAVLSARPATSLRPRRARPPPKMLLAECPAACDANQKLEQISGIAAPRRNVPLPVLYVLAAANEIWTGITKRPALISLATVRLMGEECERTHFNAEKSERELGIQFRPVAETLSDTMRWYQQNGWQHACAKEQVAACGGAASGNVENGCG